MLSVWCLVPGNYPTARRLRPLRSLIEDRTIAEKSIDLILSRYLQSLRNTSRNCAAGTIFGKSECNTATISFGCLGFSRVKTLLYSTIWTLDKMNGFWGRKRENGKTRKRDRERNWTLSRSQQWQIGSITRYFERNRFLLKPPNNYTASCLRHQKTAES